MGEITGNVSEGRFRGDVSIWLGVAVGTLFGTAGQYWLDQINGGDGNPNTYIAEELDVVNFEPEPGLLCRGLSPKDTREIIASTVICVEVAE